MRKMVPMIVTALAALVCGAAFSQTAAPARPSDFGKREFESNCASCHGISGKGNGPLVELLRRSPPDLTLLAQRNQGVFPINRLYEVVDGGDLAAHGSRDMPVWGRAYRLEDAQYYMDAPYNPDVLVRSRLLALLEYINRLQVR